MTDTSGCLKPHSLGWIVKWQYQMTDTQNFGICIWRGFEMEELNTWRDVIQAILDGKELQCQVNAGGCWAGLACFPYPAFVSDLDKKPPFNYRVKPSTIIIGDMEVPEPVRDASEIEHRGIYYIAQFDDSNLNVESVWTACEVDIALLRKGLIHKTKEAAILHAKALIKISGGSCD